MLSNNFITKGIIYPEISREKAANGYRITMQTTKEFLYSRGYITFDQLNDPKCNYTVITAGVYQAFCDGVLSCNATKQDGVSNLTPIRVSTGLSGKLETIFAITTISLANRFCLSRMTNEDLVCSKCYVPESLRIDGILAFAQNMYILTHLDLTEYPEYIPQLKNEWATARTEKKLHDAKKAGKIDISEAEILDIISRKPLCRFESLGDLACTLQAKNYLTIAAANGAGFDFALWTKNPAVLASAIDMYGKPENLSTVLSMSRKNKLDKEEMITRYKKYFDHAFVVADDPAIIDSFLTRDNFYACKCGAFSCVRCRRCYDHAAKYFDIAVEKLRDKKLK